MKVARVLTGSRLYGYHTTASDYDWVDIILDPIDSIVGFSKPVKSVQRKEGTTDVTVYGLRQFIHLALMGNPNIMDVIFSPIVEDTTDIWNTLPRQAFLSQHTLRNAKGYAKSALKNYHKTRKIKDLRAHVRMMYMAKNLIDSGSWNPVLPQGIASMIQNLHLLYVPMEEIPKTIPDSLPERADYESVNSWILSIYGGSYNVYHNN